jgi:hypothetical protein
MSEQFEYRFVTARPNDTARLETAGAEGWAAVGMVPEEGNVLILLERKIVVDTQKASLEATRRHLQGQLAEVDRALAGIAHDGWLPVPHQDSRS